MPVGGGNVSYKSFNCCGTFAVVVSKPAGRRVERSIDG